MENNDTQTASTEETPTQEQQPGCVDRLTDELKEARRCCDDMRNKAVEHLQKARSATLGDVCDGAAGFVKRHPRCSLGIAAAIGFFIGRLFRR